MLRLLYSPECVEEEFCSELQSTYPRRFVRP
jgi:hypothetical protein